MKYLLKLSFLLLLGQIGSAQEQYREIEGYVYEENNRGYISGAEITILNDDDGLEAKTITDKDGFFSVKIDYMKSGFTVKAQHKLFFSKVAKPQLDNKSKDKSFVKIELERRPGYIFDVTLAENSSDFKETTVDAIQGAKVEIYNNTTKEEVYVVDSLHSPNFNFTFEQGNHYTVMVRKKGFLTISNKC
jgi:hypothetical protein